MSQSHESWGHKPDDFTNYYQAETQIDQANNIPAALSGVLLLLYTLYTLAHHFGIVIAGPSSLLWFLCVKIIPGALLDYLDTGSTDEDRQVKTGVQKVRQMRRILRMDTLEDIVAVGLRLGKRAWSTHTRLSSLQSITGFTTSGIHTEHRPLGLGNNDNSCYQNSILQGLASLDTLPLYLARPLRANQHHESQSVEKSSFDEAEDQGSTAYPEGLTMTWELRTLMKKLRGEHYCANQGAIWTPLPLKNMDSYQQQDAQEYFSRLLDEIDKEIQKASPPNRAFLLPAFTGTTADTLKPQPQDISFLSTSRNPLEGLLAQRVGCTSCGLSEGLNMSPFNNLTLPLGRSWQYTISQCLDEYTKIERIDGVECGKCTLLKLKSQLSTISARLRQEANSMSNDNETLKIVETRLSAVQAAIDNDDFEEKTLRSCGVTDKIKVRSTKTKQIVIARPPKSLVIHMQRSMFDAYYNPIKNPAVITFPIQLDLAHWCLGSTDLGNDSVDRIEKWQLDPECSMTGGSTTVCGPLYELKAVVSHSGRHENGHYICYRRHPRISIDTDSRTLGSGNIAEGSSSLETEEQWWRLSDEDVSIVSQTVVENQGGAFMLFYDCIQEAERTQEDSAVTTERSLLVSKNSTVDDATIDLRVGISNKTISVSNDNHDPAKIIEMRHKSMQSPMIIPVVEHQSQPRMNKSRPVTTNSMVMV